MATLTLETPRHFEPYRVSEYSDSPSDALKINVVGGLWHLGNRFASAAETVLTATDSSVQAIYAQYVKSGGGDSITLGLADPAVLYANMAGTNGYLYKLLGFSTTSGGDIVSIDEAWQGGDIKSSDAATEALTLDNLSLNLNSDSEPKAQDFDWDVAAHRGTGPTDYDLFMVQNTVAGRIKEYLSWSSMVDQMAEDIVSEDGPWSPGHEPWNPHPDPEPCDQNTHPDDENPGSHPGGEEEDDGTGHPQDEDPSQQPKDDPGTDHPSDADCYSTIPLPIP